MFSFQGDAVTLWDLNVVWTAVISAIWHRKCMSIMRIGSICLALVGIVLICQPDFIFQVSQESHEHIGKKSRKCA